MTAIHIGQWKLGTTPRVVGTISTAGVLLGDPHAVLPVCDVAEVRLDHVMAKDPAWLEHCWSIEHLARPVVATLRLKLEGGAWTAPDREREPILKRALEHLSCVDVELQSDLVGVMGHEADRLRKPLIVSYHNFDETPSLEQLRDIASLAAHVCSRAIPKLATLVRTEADIDVLRKLVTGFGAPICVIGMGEFGKSTRFSLPLAGGALAYGCIDDVVAPGQVPSLELVDHFCRHVPGYTTSRQVRE